MSQISHYQSRPRSCRGVGAAPLPSATKPKKIYREIWELAGRARRLKGKVVKLAVAQLWAASLRSTTKPKKIYLDIWELAGRARRLKGKVVKLGVVQFGAASLRSATKLKKIYDKTCELAGRGRRLKGKVRVLMGQKSAPGSCDRYRVFRAVNCQRISISDRHFP
jgi:hypothetical protein